MLVFVRTIPDSSYVDKKTIADRASVHILERRFGNDFCNGESLRAQRRADREIGSSHIGEVSS